MKFVRVYFNGERNESILFILLSLISMVIGVNMAYQSSDVFKYGISTGLISIALIQMSVGISILIRSPKDIRRVEGYLQNNPSEIMEIEIPRMILVMKNFATYKKIELGLIFISTALLLFFDQSSFWFGLGFGCLIQSALMLIFDYFAEKRGHRYLLHLRDHTNNYQ